VTPSPRRQELLERAYRYALVHGLADLSLRPLASAIESSPRVLLFLFGSKDGLVRALIERARADELALLDRVRDETSRGDLATVVCTTWRWLVDPSHRPLLTLWLEAYARSLTEPDGPWAGFARQVVDDWLAILAAAQAPEQAAAHGRGRGHGHSQGHGHAAVERRPVAAPTSSAAVERTLALAVLRGALLDLLATGDAARATGAVEAYLRAVHDRAPREPDE
jgi:AcrR family transcriptional regulator